MGIVPALFDFIKILTLLRIQYVQNQIKIVQNQQKDAAKILQPSYVSRSRFLCPHRDLGHYAVLDLASSIEGSGFWDLLESWVLQSACSGMEQATTYYLFPISIFLISFI